METTMGDSLGLRQTIMQWKNKIHGLINYLIFRVSSNAERDELADETEAKNWVCPGSA